MQTNFSPRQLADPEVAASEQILRKCVHCGFCTATCPTYVLLGDELDSPRGRIYLIKDMLENDRPATAPVVQHIDRCLSCLACMTTCPSGVHYQHLIDHARVHVEKTFVRPLPERMLRALLAWVLPYPRRFRAALGLVALARPFAPLLPRRVRAMLELAPRTHSRAADQRPVLSRQDSANGAAHARERVAALRPGAANDDARSSLHATVPRAKPMRLAVLTGCVQSVIAPQINAATIRLLERAGAEVVVIPGCCGAIVHHLGREPDAKGLAARLIEQLHTQCVERGLDAIVANASGCGTQVKDFGYLFRNDAELAPLAAAVSERARDVTEILAELGLPEPIEPSGLTVAYHSACSMQHGQRVERPPRELLTRAGYAVKEIPEGHLCCGSAGTYNILQPEIATRLRDRKLASIAGMQAAVVATGNIGCITQLGGAASIPVVHTVELLDWATGGPRPQALS